MSEQGEKTCPLCAEEMDLTDQQLKPCKCGYEICVWCWHHIINMAEKDGTDGLCPACRSPYDKEKIVGMAANCERLVAEVNVDRRKAQKAKSKSSEGRKQLASVRVIQRNLVYIVGLPLNLADEDLLQQKEYFGQYGKVLKVSMSRTAAGVIQQFPNSTCSVYITYAKEDEAIRCIQSVHGFVLDGRPLKACFGTTKYCHAWLRNVPCTNPDCLYLHEIGSQEDSFTKDEIISEYTRSRVQQIIGATNNSLRRSGSTLPPPLDDYCNSTVASVKTLVKSSTIAAGNAVAVRANSPPSGNSGRSPALPSAAAWGMRASSQPQMASSAPSDIPIKPKTETASGTLNPSSAFGSDLLNEMENKVILESENKVRSSKGRPDLLKSGKEEKGEFRATPVDEPVKNGPASNVNSSYPSGLPASISNDWCSNIAPSAEDSLSHTGQSCSVGKEGVSADERKIQNLCSDFSSVRADTDARTELSGNFCTSSSLSRNDKIKSPASQLLQQTFVEEFVEPINSTANNSVAAVVNGVCDLSGQADMQRTIQNQIDRKAVFELEDEIRSFDNQRLRDPEVVTHGSHHLHSSSFHDIGRSVSNSFQHTDSFGSTDVNHDPLLVDNRVGRQSFDASCNSLTSNGFLGKLTDSSYGLVRNSDNSFLPRKEEANSMGILQGDIDGRAAADAGESRIVSSILSLDIDTWDDSLSSPQDLVRLLRESDKQPSFKMPSPWKLQNSNQSRFSFARQEESRNQSSDIDTSYSSFGQLSKNHSFGQDLVETRNSLLDNLGLSNGYSPSNHGQFETFASSPQVFSPFKSNVVPRAQVSAPPGFHPTNRTPPPGFSSQERFDQTFDSLSGNRLLDSSLLRNSYQVQGSNSSNSGDIEFMDPAILAVGKGRIQGNLSNTVGLDERSNFRQPMSSVENDPRLRLLMQKSLSSHQNIRYSDNRDNLSTIDDPYSIPSRFVEQSHLNNNPSPFTQLSVQQSRNALLSNGPWNGWNEVQGANTLNMAELLQNDGLSGLNKFYGSGYQDSKFQMPSSGNFYNRPFEM